MLRAIATPLIILLIIFESTQGNHHHHQHHQECHAKYKCSTEKHHVWATDGERCHIFRNHCMLKVEQCARTNQGKSELVETDQETCQESCELMCSADYEPICVQLLDDDSYKTFGNECELHNYMCMEETTFSYYTMGECE